jgi:hypothetical protein
MRHIFFVMALLLGAFGKAKSQDVDALTDSVGMMLSDLSSDLRFGFERYCCDTSVIVISGSAYSRNGSWTRSPQT